MQLDKRDVQASLENKGFEKSEIDAPVAVDGHLGYRRVTTDTGSDTG